MQCLCPNDTVRNQLGEEIGLTLDDRLNAAPALSIKSSLHLERYSAEAVYCGWEGVVEQYSSLAFSYPDKDRIMALLGVAREFAAMLGRMPCHKGLEIAKDGFIAGLWKGDLHRGLLWEQVAPGTHERLSRFPTWSWASINSAVRWRARVWTTIIGHPSHDDTLRWFRSVLKNELVFVACTVIACHRIRVADSLPVRSDGELLRTSQQRNQGTLCLGEGTDTESAFDVLHLRGRLQTVHIGDYLSNKVPNPAADMDDWAEEDPGLGGLRIVATAGLRDVISGWASLEHPEFQHDSALISSPMIFALLVSTVAERTSKRTHPAYAKGKEEFNVLYLRRSQRVLDGFERLGMGRLFGHAANKGFQLAKERDVRLL